MSDLEQRIALLEYQIIEHHKMYMLLLNLILHHDNNLRLKAAESLRRILQNPIEGNPMSPYVEQQIRLLRDTLLASPQPEMVELFSRPPGRSVDK